MIHRYFHKYTYNYRSVSSMAGKNKVSFNTCKSSEFNNPVLQAKSNIQYKLLKRVLDEFLIQCHNNRRSTFSFIWEDYNMYNSNPHKNKLHINKQYNFINRNNKNIHKSVLSHYRYAKRQKSILPLNKKSHTSIRYIQQSPRKHQVVILK